MWDLFIQFITTMVHVYLLTEKEKEKENPGGGLQNEGVNKRKDRRFWVEISEAANKKLKEIPPENEEKVYFLFLFLYFLVGVIDSFLVCCFMHSCWCYFVIFDCFPGWTCGVLGCCM